MRERAFIVRALRRATRVLVVIGLSFGAWERACATGFFINQQSVLGLGRVDAGNTAAADELATIFFNPAGLSTFLDGKSGLQYSVGVHLIVPRSTQRNTGSTVTYTNFGLTVPVQGNDGKNPTPPSPIPNLYIGKALGGGASVGIGVNSPFGLMAKFDEDWYGRYDAIEASLRTINLSFVGAYRKPGSGLSIGGGLDLQYARSTLASAIPAGLVDARISTKGHDYTPGFNVGVLYEWDDTRVGLHYRSRLIHTIRGSSEFSGIPPPDQALNGEVGARADLNLPAIVTVGIRKKVGSNLVVLGEFEWFDWSTFRQITIRFDDGRPDGIRETRYRDAYALALGAEYLMQSGTTLRGGLHFDTTPTVDAFRDTTVPDADRLWLGLGASFAFSDKSYLDVAFNHVFFRKTNVALTRSIPGGVEFRVNGAVDSVVNTISVGFRSSF